MHTLTKKHVVILLLIAGLFFLGSSWYVKNKQADYAAELKLLIAEQAATLVAIAEVTDRDGADAVVSRLVKDCELEDRARFDTLLGRLAQLQRAEQVEVQQLFDACGDFYAERKAVMVARLKREYEVYADYITLLSIADTRKDFPSYPTQQWSELVELEQQRSDISTQLVAIQGDLIDALLDGVLVGSAEMIAKITVAQELKDNLGFIGIKIDTLREEIIGL